MSSFCVAFFLWLETWNVHSRTRVVQLWPRCLKFRRVGSPHH
jgi:hypothetical protein